MAFIEPMHRNKPNITYLLTVLYMTAIYVEYISGFIFPRW